MIKEEAETGELEYPHYTRPEIFEYKGKKYRVPKILLSGDHKKVKEWRGKQRLKVVGIFFRAPLITEELLIFNTELGG